MKIANAMKIFDELAQSKLEVEKENKYMLSQIKYWRDKFRDLEKERIKDKDREKERIKQREPVNNSAS